MELKYNAFISYKHNEKDSAVALKLQTLLEHLHVPAEGKNIFKKDKTKRIDRIFMDSGELSSSADFLQQVEDALKNSEWLIVLCSPSSKASPWCALEVDTFLKYHDQNHILLLLTEGEPEEAFPTRLLEQDMSTLHILAADCRGESKQEMLKKLKKNALYQLAAPILGLHYDDLKQRRKTYMMQRLAIVSIAAFFVLSCFTGYILYQAKQISLNYQKARENQARFLTTISSEFLSNGDLDSALLTATAIQPKDIQKGPIVPEQFYSLNKALGSYLYNSAYLPEKTIEVGTHKIVAASPENSYSYILNSHKLTVFSNKEKKIIWTYTSNDAQKDWKKGFPKSEDLSSYTLTHFSLKNVLPYGEDRVILFTDSTVNILNVKEQKNENCIKMYSQVTALTEDTLCTHSDNPFEYSLDLYDIKTLTLKKRIDLSDFKSEEYDEYPDLTKLCLSPDGKYALFSIETDVIADYRGKDLGSGTYLIDLNTEERTMISKNSSEQFCFLDQDHIGLFLNRVSDYDSQYRLDDMRTYTYSAAIYEISSGKMLFHRDLSDNITADMSIRKMNLTIEDKKVEAVAFSLNGDLSLYDLKENKVFFNIHFHSDISNVFEIENSHAFYVTLINGSTQLVSLIGGGIRPGDGLYTNILKCDLNTEIGDALYLADEDAFLFFQKHKIIYAALKADKHYKSMVLPEDVNLKAGSIEYVGNDSMYRIVKFHNKEYDDVGVSIYPVGETDPIYSWKLNSDGSIHNKVFWEQENRLIGAIVEKTKDMENGYLLHILDITNQKELFNTPIGDFYGATSSIVFSEKENRIYISNHGREYREGISVFELQDNHLENIQYDLYAGNRIESITLSGSKDALMVLGHEAGDSSSLLASTYHFDSKEMLDLGFNPDDISFGFNTMYIAVAENSSMIFLKTSDNKSFLVDLNHPEEPIFIDETINNAVAFFDQDRYLLFGKGESLCLYDIEKSKITSTYQSDEVPERVYDFNEFTPSKDGSFFALNQGDGYYINLNDDKGFYVDKMYLFYVDKKHKIHLYVDSRSTRMSPDCQEISIILQDDCCFAPLYTYQNLVEEAVEKLGGKTLTEEELKNYIISED